MHLTTRVGPATVRSVAQLMLLLVNHKQAWKLTESDPSQVRLDLQTLPANQGEWPWPLLLETTRAQKGHFCSSADYTCSHSRDPHRVRGLRIFACARTADLSVQLCVSGPELVWLDLECSPAESARVSDSPVATENCLLSLARGLGS